MSERNIIGAYVQRFQDERQRIRDTKVGLRIMAMLAITAAIFGIIGFILGRATG